MSAVICTLNNPPDGRGLMLIAMLFKLGGQISLTMEEIHEIYEQFPRIRFVMEESITGEARNAKITLTLRSLDAARHDRHMEGL